MDLVDDLTTTPVLESFGILPLGNARLDRNGFLLSRANQHPKRQSSKTMSSYNYAYFVAAGVLGGLFGVFEAEVIAFSLLEISISPAFPYVRELLTWRKLSIDFFS